MQRNFSQFCRLLFFFAKLFFSENSFSNLVAVSNSLDPCEAGHIAGPDQSPNCLQSLSAGEELINYNLVQICQRNRNLNN